MRVTRLSRRSQSQPSTRFRGGRAILGIGAGIPGFAELRIERRKPARPIREAITVKRRSHPRVGTPIRAWRTPWATAVWGWINEPIRSGAQLHCVVLQQPRVDAAIVNYQAVAL